MNPSQKTIHGVETQWLSSKEKVLGEAVSKVGHADSDLGHDRICHYWFHWMEWKYLLESYLLVKYISLKFIFIW